MVTDNIYTGNGRSVHTTGEEEPGDSFAKHRHQLACPTNGAILSRSMYGENTSVIGLMPRVLGSHTPNQVSQQGEDAKSSHTAKHFQANLSSITTKLMIRNTTNSGQAKIVEFGNLQHPPPMKGLRGNGLTGNVDKPHHSRGRLQCGDDVLLHTTTRLQRDADQSNTTTWTANCSRRASRNGIDKYGTPTNDKSHFTKGITRQSQTPATPCSNAKSNKVTTSLVCSPRRTTTSYLTRTRMNRKPEDSERDSKCKYFISMRDISVIAQVLRQFPRS